MFGSLTVLGVLSVLAAGAFGMAGLPAGAVVLHVYDPVRGRMLAAQQVVVAADTTTQVQVVVPDATGAITGSVYRVHPGRRDAMPGVWVHVPAVGATITDTSGRYTLAEVPPGSHQVTAHDPESKTATTVTATVPPGGGTLTVDFELAVTAPGTVRGRVVETGAMGTVGVAGATVLPRSTGPAAVSGKDQAAPAGHGLEMRQPTLPRYNLLTGHLLITTIAMSAFRFGSSSTSRPVSVSRATC